MFVKELEITLENGMKISGELDLPERQGQWKTIILFHGSGPSDRHATVESMGGIVSRNFDLLSEGFVKARYAVFRYDKRENYDIEIIIRDAREVTRFVSGLSEVEGILFYGWSEGVRVCTTLVSDFPNAQALILQSGIAEGWSSYFSYILRELTVEKLKELDNNSDSILEISDFLNCIPDSTSISFSLYLLILGTDKEGNMKFNEELDPEGNALKYPERIALIYENEKVSYKMLRLYALRAANYMWQRGVRRNDKIVVILPRGIGQVAALLGILAIGAAYVPIAMKQPLGRRKKIIENVKPALVLQDEAFLEENPWTGCIENNSKDTAYIIYTSGSSGEPKGVEMSHVAAMNTIEEILHMWNIGAEDSVLNISAFDFDLSVFDIFGLLTVGGTIVLIDEDDFRDPEVWKNLIEIYGITIWNSAPALLDMFLIMGENNHFGKLRLALVSGDWIPLYLPEKWYKVTSANSQFVALGGATEGGIWSNYYCVSKVDRLWNSIPYGQALPKQKYRITDENFVECGVDIPGELQIGGGSLAKGYINDEELTMKKFITDVKGERWYRTGDRGRRWADGTIEFLGRMDTQVKIRGHRIELGEIESVLKSISRIKEAVVVAQGDKYHKELVAFYLGEYIAESEIEDYLKIHLPEYSIPNSINRLENFPLNANGKVDRRRLAEYQKTDSVEIMSDKVLNIVLMIWEELLKNKVADLDENLFKIGADSLLAARFVAAINARCGIEVRMKEVFMNPSINALTKLVDKRKNTDIAEFVEEGEI